MMPLPRRGHLWKTVRQRGMAIISPINSVERGVISFIATLIFILFAAPFLLHETSNSKAFDELESRGTREVVISNMLGLSGFVVSENGGGDGAYRHVSLKELEYFLAFTQHVPWSVDQRERIRNEGGVAFISAYSLEHGLMYFAGPTEIIMNKDVSAWRVGFRPSEENTRLYEIISATPLKVE